MSKISIITFETDIASFLPYFSLDNEVEVFVDKVDFVSCFDSDLVVIFSNSGLEKLGEFFIRNRLNVLIERRLCGGRKVICVGNAAVLLFSGDDFSGSKIDFLQQWQASVSGEVCNSLVPVVEKEENHSLLLSGESVQCKNQFLVFEHPAVGLDCKYTVPPNVAWGAWENKKFVLSVENGPLVAVLCELDELLISRVLLRSGVNV